jgi:signal transduction histidine kinase
LLLFSEAVLTLCVLGALGPSRLFPELPQPTRGLMFGASSLTSLVLLAVGVIGLVDAHARVASELDRVREDLLQEAERRAISVEHLGAQVAHEVKNPLAAARGLVQLVERRVTDQRDRERLGVVVGEIDRALLVLGDYLSFARPLSDLKLGSIDLFDLLKDVAAVLEARVHGKALTLRVEGERVELLGDRQRLRDALLNLALNAVTALPPGGGLELRVTRREQSAVLLVKDDGPGMSAELLAKLGQPFTSASEGGTGLGVLLAQSVARQHGGWLRFESAPSTGTSAILELPLRRLEHD